MNTKNLRRFTVFIITSFSLLSCFSISQEKRLEIRTTTQWGPYLEWSVENPFGQENPFDLKATVIFRHPETSTIIQSEMFYAGDNTWKFRFTPTKTGKWIFITNCKNKQLNGLEGIIEVNENPDKNAHGFIKNFGCKWGWQGTEKAFIPQYVMGKELDSYYDFEQNRVKTDAIENDIREFIVEHGFTGFHIQMGKRWFSIDGKGEVKNPDVRAYQVLETIISKVHALGGACHIWMWGSDGGRDNNKGDGPRGILGESENKNDLRNLSYLAARLGPVPGWSMGYGIDTENGVATLEQLNNWKSYLEANMGWHHFLGARVGYDEKGLWALRPQGPRPEHDENYCSEINDNHCFWLGGDYIGYTSYRPLFKRYREAIDHHPEKPSFEEDRFRIRNSKQWNYKDYNEELTRRGLWHSAMAGGVANIWGNLIPKSNHGGSNPYANKYQIKTYSQFFKYRFLKSYKSNEREGQFFLTSTNSKHAVIYAENTLIIHFNEVNKYVDERIIAVDTKKKYAEVKVIPDKSGTAWKAPYKSDWAIAIGSFPDNEKHPN